jgi:phosphate transport system substrate-binding protein
VPVYNIPNVTAELKFSGPLLADIFLGKVTKWNDPAIVKLNGGRHPAGHRHHRRAPRRRLGHDLHLGRLPVEGVARMEKQSRVKHVGEMARPAVGGRGNEGRGERSSRRRRGRSATSSSFTRCRPRPRTAAVQNMAGEFTKASVASVTAAAAAAAAQMPADFRVSITNAPGKGVYPISSFTWLLPLRKTPRTRRRPRRWWTS